MSAKSRNTVENNNTKVIFVRQGGVATHRDGTTYVTNEPKAAIAYVAEDSLTRGAAVILFATSWCHPNDRFVKAVGRAKAAGRLRSKSFHNLITIPTDKPLKDFSGRDWAELENALRVAVIEAKQGGGE